MSSKEPEKPAINCGGCKHLRVSFRRLPDKVFCKHPDTIIVHGDWRPVADMTQSNYQRPGWCPILTTQE